MKNTHIWNIFVRHIGSHFICNLYADYSQLSISILDLFPEPIILTIFSIFPLAYLTFISKETFPKLY